VEKDFPASQAGIMVGDVITTVEGEPIIDPQTFSFFIAQRRLAGTLNVKYLRKGAEQSAVIGLK
jgi:S1-C subfamily serine protease